MERSSVTPCRPANRQNKPPSKAITLKSNDVAIMTNYTYHQGVLADCHWVRIPRLEYARRIHPGTQLFLQG